MPEPPAPAAGTSTAAAAAGEWYLVCLRLPAPAQDAGCEALRAAGAAGLEVIDREHLAPPADLGPDEVEARAYFPAAAPPGLAREAALAFAARARAWFPDLAWRAPEDAVRLLELRPGDWIEAFRAHFHPVRLGRFQVVPSWLEPAPDAPWTLSIDPGLAFGTGLHPTTRLCLLGLDELLAAGAVESVLDLGCGTGVLALGAARAGVPRVLAVDCDPEACRVTHENLALNGLAGRVEVLEGQARDAPGSFQVVLANILSGVLMAQAGQIVARLEAGGALLLSGILAEERAEVLAAYLAQGCRPRAERLLDGWALLCLER
jgi:ribosomal protein L11 methyltransferase